MNHTYIIEIISTQKERNDYLVEKKANILYERFNDRREAQEFCDMLNNTIAFKYYNETANIVKEI